MAQPAVVMNDSITAQCIIHQVPGPTGSPVPSPSPLPFRAPINVGLARSVLAGGKPVAVQGSSGYNTPPHLGLHASDPYVRPDLQEGRVVAGSGTVLAEGTPVAYTGCAVAVCAQAPGTVAGSAASVLVGP